MISPLTFRQALETSRWRNAGRMDRDRWEDAFLGFSVHFARSRMHVLRLAGSPGSS
jgi:hypothetical protein